MSKKLIINADDYGLCPEVNAAIENLVKAGKLQNVSLLVNSDFYEEAADFLLNHPGCSVGVHLNVVEGNTISSVNKAKVLLDNNDQFVNLNQLLARWLRSPLAVSKAVEMEWRAQIEFLLNSGIKISHADSHQHIHAFPPFWKILIKLCREYSIRAVRLPREKNKLRSRFISSFALQQAATVSKTLFSLQNIHANNHFLGFKRAGSYGEIEMINDLQNLKAGVTELIIHPSLCDGVPYPALRGALEYEALSSSNVWKQITESNIEVTNWTEFAKTKNLNLN